MPPPVALSDAPDNPVRAVWRGQTAHVSALPHFAAAQAQSAGHVGVGSILEQSCAFVRSLRISKAGRTQLFSAGVSVRVRDPGAAKKHL